MMAPSGAGKTTLLRILAGLEKVDSGQIEGLEGLRISMVFQEDRLCENLSASANIRLVRGKKPWGRDKKLEAKISKAMAAVGLGGCEDQPVREFSGGMRQRVMIAMALANKPELLIADEPTTALDVTIQDQILRQLRELDKEYGASIIFITHDLGVVAELCDRVLVMYGGLIMEEARIEDIFEQPGHPYTMGLLHSIPDVEQEKSERLEPIPGSPPDMTNPPAGCPFAPRCSYARKVCAGSLPDFVEVGEGHRTRCFLQYEDAPADEHNPFRGGNR